MCAALGKAIQQLSNRLSASATTHSKMSGEGGDEGAEVMMTILYVFSPQVLIFQISSLPKPRLHTAKTPARMRWQHRKQQLAAKALQWAVR